MANRLSEELAVVCCIDPDAYTTGAVTGDWIDMKYHDRVMFIVMAGDLGTSATVDFAVQQASDSGGTGAKALATAKAITQLTDAGTDSNKQAVVEVHATDLDVAGGFTFVSGVLTVGAATSDAGVVGLASRSSYSVAADYDLASVDEIVA